MATAALATAKPTSPNVIDWMSRLRVPLTAIAVGILSLDAIGLAVHWADSTNSAIRDQAARDVQARVQAPATVVDGSSLTSGSDSVSGDTGTGGATTGGTNTAFVGPVAPPVVTPPPSTPGGTPAPTTPAVPLAQVDLAVPGVAQVSLGLGENSCTTIDLTLLALGGCPAPTGDGPVILNLGGTLLGQK